MNRLFLVAVVLCVSCSLSSCSIWQKVRHRRSRARHADTAAVVVPDTTALIHKDTLVVIPSIPVDSNAVALLHNSLPIWNLQTSYTTFSGRAKVSYEGKDQKEDISVNIKIEKDKKVWISVTALGLVEVARVFITPDTIIVIDRMHKEVQILPFAEADKVLPMHVDFATLQSLLIGDVLRTGNIPSSAVDTGSVLHLFVIATSFDQQVVYSKRDSTLTSQQLATTGSSLSVQYGDYGTISGRRFSNNRVMDMKNKGERYHIEMQFNRAAFDEPIETNFSIPSKYSRK